MFAIKELGAQSIQLLSEAERLCFSSPWNFLELDSLLNESVVHCLGAFFGQTISGYCISREVIDELEILRLATIPQFRGKGLATRLLFEQLERAGASGCKHAWLEVRATNLAAIGLYGKIGFEFVGTRAGYYSNPVDDAVVFYKKLIEKHHSS